MTNQIPEGSQFHPIELPVGATAKPNTCGTCKFFNRVRAKDYGADRGVCEIVLPPWVQDRQPSRSGDSEQGYEGPLRMLRDVDRCDLQRPTGKFYQISQVVGPGGALR